MNIHLQYGKGELPVELPSSNVTVLAPRFVEGLADEAAGFREAVRAPIGCKPLRERIGANDRVAIVIPDLTRPLPTERLLRWTFAELDHVPAERFTIVNGTGSHRVNTPDELKQMVGAEILAKYRVVNHNSHDPQTLARAGQWPDGQPILMNKACVEADKRIVMGFIEPHFIAGFSGGYKGVFPAVADIGSIMRYHGAMVVGDPRSTWGELEGNPTQAIVRQAGSALPIDFLINVTQNKKRQITKFFCGHPMEAHVQGCAHSKSTVMAKVEKPFPIVITTNSGYPLDQNLYQAVKGMSAAAKIATEGGFILSASECCDGFPEHGNFRTLLFDHDSPQAILKTINAPGFSLYDQWEAQLLAMICVHARVGLHSLIPADQVARAHLEPVADIGARIGEELRRIGRDAAIAVLPEGPMTIPYLD
ncbi:MAG: nickel-dependent lactate racemase [Planctomycetota bacterium]|nr:nickel-dependent lactate racemase [Planctomycetota bacterium]